MAVRPRRWPVAGLLALLSLLVAPVLSASSLQVAPTRLELSSKRASEALWVTNTGTTPLHLQVRVFEWRQVDGQDQLAPTDAIQPSPPAREIPAGQQQLVRLVRTDPSEPLQQQAFRVLVDELPRLDPDAKGMLFVLRYSVPLFVQPAHAHALRHRLTARGRPMPDGRPGIEVRNDGDSYAQLADVALGDPRRPRIIRPGLVGYVLPGRTMHWALDTEGLQEGVTFSAKINGESVQTALPATAPAR